ncbi:MAG: FAD-binding protein [Cytophagales bacterium]|nr:FAD-binding protein [Cytophagales bacterium]
MDKLSFKEFKRLFQIVLDYTSSSSDNSEYIRAVDVLKNFSVGFPELAYSRYKKILAVYQRSENISSRNNFIGIEESGGDFYNNIRTIVSENVTIYTPTTLGQLSFLIKDAKTKNFKVKAIGQGLSYSTITQIQSGNVIINMEKLTGEDGSPLNYTPLGDYISVKGGTDIKEINDLLEQRGKAMINLGGTNLQSIAGVLATSTHGSGINYGPLCDLVESLLIVDGEGKLIRLMPSAINPLSFSYTIPTDDTNYIGPYPVAVMNDDDLFYAALVGMGCMGIVYSVVLKVTDAFDVQENRYLQSWEQVKTKIFKSDAAIKSTDHLEVYLNPYDAADTGKQCVVTYRNRVPRTEYLPRNSATTRRFVSTFWNGFYLLPSTAYRLFKTIDWMNSNADVKMGKICSNLESGLTRLEDNQDNGHGGYLNRSFKVFNADLKKFEISATGIEVCLPYEYTADFVDDLFLEIENLVHQNKVDHQGFNFKSYLMTIPMGIRFVKSSKAFLSMMNDDSDKIFCTIEIPSLIMPEDVAKIMYDDDRATLLKLQNFILNYPKCKIRFHWGLSFSDGNIPFPSNTYMQSRYPNTWNKWKNARLILDTWDTFKSPFVEKMLAN